MTAKQPTHLVVDGSNIATEGRSAPSLEQLDEAVRAILEEFPHDRLTVVVDATFGHRIAESERPAYEEAILAGEVVAPPAGAIGRGDAFILQVADKANATVFSNDSFQEFHGEHEWLFDEGRLVGGKPVPGVGWVFVNRVPVRGPASRRSVRESKRAKPAERRGRRVDPAKAIEEETRERRSRKAPPRRKATKVAAGVGAEPAPPAEEQISHQPDADDARPTASGAGAEALNEPPVFLAFITRHRIGSVLEATVDHFSSHGAYVVADGARCYLPTKTMGQPPPNRARDIIDRHDVVRVEVQSLDAERRGINVRFVDVLRRHSGVDGAAEPAEPEPAEPLPLRSADESGQGQEPRSDYDVATKRTAAKKSAAQRAPSGRTTVKKTVAKKAAAEATPSPRATKAAAKKAPAKKAPAKKASVAKAAAENAPTNATAENPPTKATAKEAATKASARKAAAAKAVATKAVATKAVATKATAAKVTAKKAPAKKAAVKKAAVKKAAAGTSTAKKATAKKATAKKTTAKRATKRASATDTSS